MFLPCAGISPEVKWTKSRPSDEHYVVYFLNFSISLGRGMLHHKEDAVAPAAVNMEVVQQANLRRYEANPTFTCSL